MKCEKCSSSVKKEDSYILKIVSHLEYNTLEIGQLDLLRDIEWELEEALKEADKKTIEELEDEVGRAFKFRICRECYKKLIKVFKSDEWKNKF